jgi:hypothetical protein
MMGGRTNMLKTEVLNKREQNKVPANSAIIKSSSPFVFLSVDVCNNGKMVSCLPNPDM